MTITIERISGVKNQLGEGPVWDITEGALYWIDGHAPAIYVLDPKTNEIRSWKVPNQTSSFALRQTGGAICALGDGFYFFDFASGSATPVPNGIVAKPGTNFNDGETAGQLTMEVALLKRGSRLAPSESGATTQS
jgi:sugar lactone lactonase YvrE